MAPTMTDRTDIPCDIHPAARVHSDAVIGPFATIGPNVTIGPGTVLGARVTITGRTTIGSNNVIGDGCVLGAQPQDLKYGGATTLLVIGHNNRLGRLVTAHPGTESGGYVTRIGDSNVLADGCHVAHDCYVDSHTKFGRYVQLAGHVLVEDGAVLDAFSGCHHFVTVGHYARIGARTPVRRDVPPFTLFASEDYDRVSPAVQGMHEEGIAAAHLETYDEFELRRTLHELFQDEMALQTKIEHLENMGIEGSGKSVCDFITASLQGKFGRIREGLRGQIPPEALPHLTPEIQARLR
jgi:UDP-N-acetylglucosamine acyltransferase